LDVGERHVANHRVDLSLGQARVPEILDADVLARMECPGNAARDAVQLDADIVHPFAALAHEASDAAAWLQDGGTLGNAEAGKGLVHGGDNGRRRVERVEGGAL